MEELIEWLSLNAEYKKLSKEYFEKLNDLKKILNDEQISVFIIYEKAADDLRSYITSESEAKISSYYSVL